jgi:dynein heavy chain 2, cytosolic
LVSDKGSGQEIISGTPLRIPTQTDHASFLKIIGQLPDNDAPYVFSLPDNVERSLQRSTSMATIKDLRALSSFLAEASKYDRDKWRAQLSPLLDLWQQLTSSNSGLLSKRPARESNSPRGGGDGFKMKDPVDDFVSMEFDLAGEICSIVDVSLVALKKVLFGSGLLTPAIQAIATALLSGTVPAEWLRRWDRGPEKPQAWLREVVRKRVSLTKWKTQSSRGALLSEALGLGDLFNPATFVNALRQQTARQLRVAIDRVKMVSAWGGGKDAAAKQALGKCPLPCALTSLLLQGAAFSATGYLQEPAPEASEICPAPQVQFGFVAIENQASDEDDGTVAVPVYLNPTREEFLMEFQVPVGKAEKDKWILAGVAMFLSEDE